MRILEYTCCLLVAIQLAHAQTQVEAQVSSKKVVIGDSITLAIYVVGKDVKPDTAVITDFYVAAGGTESRYSNINGQVSRYVAYKYQLTPKRSGTLRIPSVMVGVLKTQPISILATKPQERDDMKFIVKPLKSSCYAGEAVDLECTWLLTRDVGRYQIKIPVLEDPDVTHVTGEPPARSFKLSVGDQQVAAKRMRKRLGGKQYTAFQFSVTIIPQRPGKLVIPDSTIQCAAAKGRDRWGDTLYEKLIIPAAGSSISVKPVPESGKPPSYNGLVGKYSISATAAPREVNVGDPITLAMVIRGPYLESVQPPALHRLDVLTKDFKVPEEMGDGRIQMQNGKPVIVFTQTIRAKHPDVDQIPPLQLPHFDVNTGKYSIARSEAIPIEVRATRVITIDDAEGRTMKGQTVDQAIESATGGIAHNYTGFAAVKNRERGHRILLSSMAGVAFVSTPPVIYLILLVLVSIVRARHADPEGIKARRAMGVLNNSLKAATSTDAVLNAIQDYLGSKLRTPGRAIVFNDVADALRSSPVDDFVLADLKAIFETCEAARYGAGEGDLGDLIERCRRVTKALEEVL